MSARTLSRVQKHDVPVTDGAALAGVVAHGMAHAQLRARVDQGHADPFALRSMTIFGPHLELERVLRDGRHHVHDALHRELLA